EEVQALLTALTSDKGPEASAAAYNQYTASWGSKPGKDDIKKTVIDIETDYIFLVPTQTSLYLHAKHAKWVNPYRTGRTYSYLLSEPSRLPGYPTWMGADHADDLQYVFGKPFTTPLAYLPKHRRVAKYMIAYWTNFAKTGDPNIGESKVPVAWPKLTDGDQFVEINHDTGKNSIKQKMRARFVYFWSTTYTSFPNVN
ncbi:bile salt-activated lipase, partial [Tachysurus ichikawai]